MRVTYWVPCVALGAAVALTIGPTAALGQVVRPARCYAGIVSGGWPPDTAPRAVTLRTDTSRARLTEPPSSTERAMFPQRSITVSEYGWMLFRDTLLLLERGGIDWSELLELHVHGDSALGQGYFRGMGKYNRTFRLTRSPCDSLSAPSKER